MKKLLIGLTLFISMSSFGIEYKDNAFFENHIDSTNVEASEYWANVITGAGDDVVKSFEIDANRLMLEVDVFDKCFVRYIKDKKCLNALDKAQASGLSHDEILKSLETFISNEAKKDSEVGLTDLE
mgnify:CR=1 FL=1